MARLTARQALRDAYAGGAIDGTQAQALAMLLLMRNGYDEQAARRAVDAAFAQFFETMRAV